MNHTRGSLALVAGVLVVAGFAIAGLAGWVDPVIGAAVGLGAQVVGTIAFFGTYYIGSRNEDSTADASVSEGAAEGHADMGN